MHVKTVKVTNSKNVIVQVPGFIVEKWGLKEGDSIDVILDDKEGAVVLAPKKGYVKVLQEYPNKKCPICNEDTNMYGGCKCNGYTHG